MYQGPERHATATPIAIPIDAVADATLSLQRELDVDDPLAYLEPDQDEVRCDACDELIEGEPAGHGLYMWTRGDEVRFEEPPLCGRCATAIGVTALHSWSVEEEDG